MTSKLAGWCVGLATTLMAGLVGAGADDTVELRRAESASVRFHAKLPWRDVEAGRVKLGAQLRCGGTCEVALSSGNLAVFGDGSEIGLEPPRFVKTDAPVARKVDAVRLDRGRVAVTRRGTPTVIVAGGVELLLHDGSVEAVVGDARVALSTGDATIARRVGRGWETLAAGQIVVIEGDRVEERALPSAPRWRLDRASHQPLGLAADGPEGAVSLAWQPAPQVEAMRLEVAEDAAFTRRVRDLRVPAAEGRAVLRLREGNYHARLAAVDRDGFVSPPSATMPLRVLRVALPDGGLVPEPGTVVLPAGSALRLLSVDGLEMSLGGHGFVPATREIALAQGRVELRLRVKETLATESAFTLEPRALKAAITMAPFAPIWPTDTVEIRVELRDPRGRHDLDRVEPRFRVHLENEEIFVTWSRKGGVHHARIHGRRIDGPSLLRVQVEDAAGRSLGENLVEIVSAR